MPGPPWPATGPARGAVIGVSKSFGLVIMVLMGGDEFWPDEILELRRGGQTICRVRVDHVFDDQIVCSPEGAGKDDRPGWPPTPGPVMVAVAD